LIKHVYPQPVVRKSYTHHLAFFAPSLRSHHFASPGTLLSTTHDVRSRSADQIQCRNNELEAISRDPQGCKILFTLHLSPLDTFLYIDCCFLDTNLIRQDDDTSRAHFLPSRADQRSGSKLTKHFPDVQACLLLYAITQNLFNSFPLRGITQAAREFPFLLAIVVLSAF